MGDQGEGLDPCACLWSHEMAMQRLLSILRQTQAYCTDTECLSVPRLPVPGNALNEGDFMMVCMMAVVGFMLYYMRPKSLRQSEGADKGADRDDGFDGEPPLPPPAIN
ncbi:hypothetical protein QAD02_010670 [Eretmocerus hayati]|uniref:Uncharacterized protein n=1 Tax=Eretmocerus hayati TaxID=131215 RepID=A0ACC2NX66_9HYME|nr:hypothetical protein QAD02_010670 [Eretmocerus hayati]